jgi:SAM-dependent methyltransferase
MPNIDTLDGQWPQVADSFLRLIGPPLRPLPADIEIVEMHVSHWHAATGRPPRALILGVTPEYYHLGWPQGSIVRAIDRTKAMIHHVWPGPVEHVTQAEWLDLSVANDSLDIVLCDGGLHLLPYPDEQAELARRLAASLAPGGRCLFRLFAPRAPAETPEQVLDALKQRTIPSLNILKLRLGMALQTSAKDGVKLDDVWCALDLAFPDQPSLARHLGWSEEHLGAINAYRGKMTRYHFVTEDEAIATLESAGLKLHARHQPDYLLGEHCPTLVFAGDR